MVNSLQRSAPGTCGGRQRLTIVDQRRPAGDRCLHPTLGLRGGIDIALTRDSRLAAAADRDVAFPLCSLLAFPFTARPDSHSDRIEPVIEVVPIDRGDGANLLCEI